MLCKSQCGRTKHYGSRQRRHGRQQPWWRRPGRAPDEEEDDDDDDESCGGGGGNDNERVEEHLGHRIYGAISALLGPLAAAANCAVREAARSACATTGLLSASAVGPRARSDAHARDAGRGGGGGSSSDGYDNDDDDNDDEINSAMLYSLQSSFHSVSVRSLSGTALTPTTILLPLHIDAIHGVSHEKPAAEGLVDSRERRTSAEFEGDGDILGRYCRWEEEDCTGAAAKCCNIEHVTNKVEQIIGDSKAKMGQGGGCWGR